MVRVVSRRRRWTLEQKLSLVEAMLQPGVSVAAVSDRHGVSRSLLFEWRRQAREGTMPGMVGRQAPAALVPVRVVADKPPRHAARSPRSTTWQCHPAAMIEVVLRNGRTLRFVEAIEPEVLGRLAAVLDA